MNSELRVGVVAGLALCLAACGGGGGGGDALPKQPTYTVGGTVTGLSTGPGQPALPVVLTNQSTMVSDIKTVTVNGNTSFAFPAVPTGTEYQLSIASPPGYTCVFANANGNGSVAGAAVNNLNVVCTAGQYSIRGQVSGLGTGNPGLQLINGVNALAISGDGPFAFTQTAFSGSTYNVTIGVPHSVFTCGVQRGSGTIAGADISDILVSCVTPVRVTVSGVSAGGIQLNNSYRLPGATASVNDAQLTVNGSNTASFATSLPSGATYSVSVANSPNYSCNVANPTGTVGTTAINLSVTCAPVFTVGGTVRGLMSGRSVVLRNNGADNLTVSANGAFTFPTSLASGANYSISVLTQPTGESCSINGSYSPHAGTVSAAVTNIFVSCSAPNSWTWMGGANTQNSNGTYGTKGIASQSNIPRAMQGAVTWTDTSGNFWLYGGDETADMWRYSPSTWGWTWVAGPGTLNPPAVYGPKNAPSTLHLPGTRSGGVSWRSSDGKFWLFGGYGVGQSNQQGTLHDLWKFDPTDSTWTWVTGSGATDGAAVYGTQGTPSTTNTPGARTNAVAWVDLNGHLFLFGGQGRDANGNFGLLNDVWRFRPNQQDWTWVSGPQTIGGNGVYGTRGVITAGSIPGARYGATAWGDGVGRLWMFGGYGFGASGGASVLNDLWLYNGAGQWIWVHGSTATNAPGVFGALQTPTPTTVPGSRRSAKGWTDSSGMLWLFGGVGNDSTGAIGKLDDVWRFDTGSGAFQWQWMGGHTLTSERVPAVPGVYGTLGIPDANNLPGAREDFAVWGNPSMSEFWIFGGLGYDSTNSSGLLNDFWRFRWL